jgi:hypothetical protein
MAVSIMSEETNLFSILDGLVDSWCERRALKPLRHILSAYPLPMGLTDEWEKLYDALRDIRAICRDELEAGEKERLNQAIVDVQNALDRR